MKVTLIGMGAGTMDTLTAQAYEALKSAQLVIGSTRMLQELPQSCTALRCASIRPDEIAAQIQRTGVPHACVLFSGDTGFYAGTRQLLARLKKMGAQTEMYPGISSVQLFAARLERSWQDWNLVPARRKICDPILYLRDERPTFFLMGGEQTPQAVCALLARAGLGSVPVIIGENLSYENERIIKTTAEQAADEEFAVLSVLLVEAVGEPFCAVGMAEHLFITGSAPPVSQELRAVIAAKLSVQRHETVWCFGASESGIAIELAYCARQGRAYAAEADRALCALLERNRRRFGTWNLNIVHPKQYEELPLPDAVFLGSGQVQGLIPYVLKQRPAARFCIAAMAPQTLAAAVGILTKHSQTVQVTQLSVSQSHPQDSAHRMIGQNPVWLITNA